jgi:hypothetical protein
VTPKRLSRDRLCGRCLHYFASRGRTTRPPRGNSDTSSGAPASHASRSAATNSTRLLPGRTRCGTSRSRVRSCTVRIEQCHLSATSTANKYGLALTPPPTRCRGLRIPRPPASPHGYEHQRGDRTKPVRIPDSETRCHLSRRRSRARHLRSKHRRPSHARGEPFRVPLSDNPDNRNTRMHTRVRC